MAGETDYLARGLEVAAKLWGARAGGQELPAQKLAPEFFGLAAQFVFGMFWSRPNLDLRSRSLCTVAQLAALGRTEELKLHLAGALNLGIKREQLIEALMQTACYAGVPAGLRGRVGGRPGRSRGGGRRTVPPPPSPAGAGVVFHLLRVRPRPGGAVGVGGGRGAGEQRGGRRGGGAAPARHDRESRL